MPVYGVAEETDLMRLNNWPCAWGCGRKFKPGQSYIRIPIGDGKSRFAHGLCVLDSIADIPADGTRLSGPEAMEGLVDTMAVLEKV